MSWTCHRCNAIHAPHIDTCPVCLKHTAPRVPSRIIEMLEEDIRTAKRLQLEDANPRAPFVVSYVERVVNAVKGRP